MQKSNVTREPIVVNLPDTQSLEEDVPMPDTIVLVQAAKEGEECPKKEYHSQEEWARRDREAADRVELLTLKMSKPARWFWSYVFKAAFIGMGYYLRRKHKRYSKTTFSKLPMGLEKDRDAVLRAVKKRFKRGVSWMAINGWVNAFYDFLSIDNAYEVLYWNVRREVNNENPEP